MKAELGEFPLSIVQPRTVVDAHFQPVETTGTLTTEPLIQEISDTSLVTAYLRGLNRRPGWELAWHNDAVIWNLSLRLGKMEIGQEVKVRVSYFSTKGIGSGVYEIKLLDVFHEDTATKSSTQESIPSPQSPVVAPSPNAANKTGNQVFSTPAAESRQEDIADTVSQLAARVDNLQDQLMMVRKTLHQVLEQVERLETQNRQPVGSVTMQDVTSQHPPQNTPAATAKQTVTVSEGPVRQTTNSEDDTDEPNLFEYLAESQKKSTTVKNPQKKQ
ncbi:MAG: hypothetical protein OXT74_19025 [Candidatus Poribacteria bacterium]|nr:hypothetical protein [Candidatus Poribacteria bacterium]